MKEILYCLKVTNHSTNHIKTNQNPLYQAIFLEEKSPRGYSTRTEVNTPYKLGRCIRLINRDEGDNLISCNKPANLPEYFINENGLIIRLQSLNSKEKNLFNRGLLKKI